jgi:predicted lipoprotein with Yx(FWY)xxD motif
VPSSLKLILPALAATLLLGACGGSSGAGSSMSSANASTGVTVKTAANSTLGSTVLVDQQGLTLYRLSGEQAGRFICTGACLKLWHPLTVSAGAKPMGGLAALGVVKRPEGNEQVTYKGMPLYTFVGDRKPGDAKGQGIKDRGSVWTADTTGAASSAAAAPAASTTSSSSSGGGYGY